MKHRMVTKRRNPNGGPAKTSGFKKALPFLAVAGVGLFLVQQAQGGVSFLPFGKGAPVYPASQWWYNPATGRYVQASSRPSLRSAPVQAPPQSSIEGQLLQSATRAAIPPVTAAVARWVQNLFQAEQVSAQTSQLNVLGFDQPIRTGYESLLPSPEGLPADYVEPFSGNVLPEAVVNIDAPVDLGASMDYQEPIYYLDDFGGEGADPLGLSLILEQI